MTWNNLQILDINFFFPAKNTTTAFAKPGTWPFSKLAFSDEDYGPTSFAPMEKLLRNQEISVPSASTPVA
jgi:hypothetical protein